MAVKNEYNDDSIKALKGAERVRYRPSVIFGSNNIEGCKHTATEIISNAIDEAREGFGNKIIVTLYSDHSIEVEDFGRGIPVGYNKNEGKYNWELLFCSLYAGGKYNNNDGENYEFSQGLNGLGLASTQYVSEYMDAEIKRDGKKYTLHFEKGECVGGLKEEPYSGKATGTKIRWKPDLEVFTEIDIPLEHFTEMLKKQSVVNENVRFILRNQNGRSFDTYEFFYKNGVTDYVSEIVGDDALTSVQTWQADSTGKDRADYEKYKLKIKAALCFSNKMYRKEFYHNSSFLENGGAPEKAVRSAFVSQIDSYIKSAGKYQKNESRITFQDIDECLVLVVSSFSTVTSYENQTKKAITNKFIQDSMTEFFKHHLEIYFIENKAEADRIVEQVLINKRSRERSEKERLNIKKTLQTKSDMTGRVKKFVDCRSRDTDERELYIVEGDSALGSVKLARNPDFQAVIPVRGKILNCLKADYGRIFKSDIITDLLKVMGCGVEVKSKANKDLSTFDISRLLWNKIIICTDADVDGFQIRTLILTMFYRLTPTLIEQGKIFIAETPLFEIRTKSQTYYAYSEREKNDVLKDIEGEKYTILRSKGLGENEPDMMSLTTMNPKTRRLIRVMPAEAEATARMFDMLLGDDLDGRKDFIAKEGSNYIDMADVS